MASLLRHRTGAEDVTALAFERAYRRRASYRPSRGTAEDALASLRVAFNLGLRALGVLIALSVLALVGALGIRAARRRRRESVLT